MKLHGQQIAITGANRGIGLGIAEMCAAEGAHLHLIIRQSDASLVAELKRRGALSVTVWPTDLSDKAALDSLISGLNTVSIDILINNAGLLTGGLIENQSMDEIYALFQVNVLTLIQLTRGLLPGMVSRGSGKIVNNASVSALMHFPCASTYAASKAAVYAFTNCIDAELTGTGVTTLCLITPGIKTRMFDEIAKKYGTNFEVPDGHISTEEYAQQIKTAILNDARTLMPKGATAVGLAVAKYIPKLFQWETKRRFRR